MVISLEQTIKIADKIIRMIDDESKIGISSLGLISAVITLFIYTLLPFYCKKVIN